MKSAMIALILTIWTLPVLGAPRDLGHPILNYLKPKDNRTSSKGQSLSTNMANFLTVYNGYYDNWDQYERSRTVYDYVQLTTIPAATPVFPDRPVVFVEWALNGAVLSTFVITPFEGSDGGFHLPLYSLTDQSTRKPGEYNVEDLSKLTPRDLQPSTCEAEFYYGGPGAFTGIWPECRNNTIGKPVIYTDILTCGFQIALIQDTAGIPSRLTTILIRKGDKFPVPNLPNGFISPCM